MAILFNTIIYMSFISCFVALFIIAIRSTIGKMLPAIFSYLLWLVLLFRLIVPISFTSGVSLFNFYPVISERKVEYANSNNLLYNENLQNAINDKHILNKSIDIEYEQIIIIYMVIAISLIFISIVAYIYTMNKLKEAIIHRHYEINDELEIIMKKKKINVYSIDGLKTPIVCGILRTKIIVPTYLTLPSNEGVLKNIIRHEIIHIQRKDHIIKLISIFVACIHWFNPLVWIALILSHKDMERSCDEKVIQISKENIRKEYAQALLSFTLERDSIENATVVTFGESNTKTRIKGILKYKKPNTFVKLLSIIILILVALLAATDASSKTIVLNLDSIKEQRIEEWTDLDDISKYVLQATVVSQDKNFKDHNGIDITSIIRAGLYNLKVGDLEQGGSTITQQLVRNIYDFEGDKGLAKKRTEIYAAIKLEKNYSKEEIMEAYLNIIGFGRNIKGIGDASKYYFGKLPSDLSKEESAKLMVIIDNPIMYDPISQIENNNIKAKKIIDNM